MTRKKVITNIIKTFYDLFHPQPERKEPMLNLVLPFVANMLRDVVVDKAQSLAIETLQPHLDKLPPDVKKALDDAVDGDNSHGHKSLGDLLKG
jgi:hypothetical protein